MWTKAFFPFHGFFHSFASSLALSSTKAQCEASVLRRKSVWNELNGVSPVAASHMCPSSFLIVDREETGLNSDSLLGKGFWEIRLAVTLVHCDSKSSDVNTLNLIFQIHENCMFLCDF